MNEWLIHLLYYLIFIDYITIDPCLLLGLPPFNIIILLYSIALRFTKTAAQVTRLLLMLLFRSYDFDSVVESLMVKPTESRSKSGSSVVSYSQ